MPARTNRILEVLTERERVEVSTLAEELGVSQVTMRKDLTELERRGLIRREHGFAVLRSADNVEGRLAYHYEEKRTIARRAADLVHDGDTIMVESGSCCALLVAELAAAGRDVTVVTNSAFIAGYVRDAASVQTVLLGGIYQKDSQVMVGPMVRTCVEGFYVDLLFAGADGFSPRTGFTNSDQMPPASPTATRCAPRRCATWRGMRSASWCSRRARSSAVTAPCRSPWARRTSP